MRIQVISDLHQKFGFMDISFEGVDLIILAGDINLGAKGIVWIKSTITDVPVIYVLGNHGYYKGSYPKTLNAIRNLASDSNVDVLENKAVVIDDVTSHGATLWPGFALPGDSRLNGSICQASLESASTKKNIVVTHHAPSIKSLLEDFKNDVLSSAYASNLEPLILEYKPHYYIHGHIHQPIKSHVGDTVVLCNPHGYIDEPYNGFDKNLIIEI